MHNFFDILVAIKLILGWDVFFRSASLKFSEGMMCVLQTKTRCSRRLEDPSILGSKILMERGQAQRKGGARDAGWRGLSIMKDLSIHFENLPGSPGEQRDRASAAPLAVPCQ